MICHYINSDQSNFEFEHLDKFKTKFENILGFESVVQVGLIDRKAEVKNLMLLSV
jgi:hypothetical protein